MLRNDRAITTLFGRRRFFFGRPTEDSTIREAIAYAPQSMTADEINLGLLNLFRTNKVQLLVQVHDSLLFQYPEELEDEIIPLALDCLKVPLRLRHGREFVVPVDAKVGWNWGDTTVDKNNAITGNEDGLMKWKGTDKRKRQRNLGMSLAQQLL
jgi:DNA polymerase I-like protein with 3'-5' exonuclease and polymerase domains